MDPNLEKLIIEINEKYEEQLEGGIFLEAILFGLLLREREKSSWLEFKLNEEKKRYEHNQR